MRVKQQVSDEQDAPTRIVLPFKDQKSANAVRHQLSDLIRKIDAVVQPVYVSKKIKGHFKPKEHKPPVVNQQNVVYHYKCSLCDTDYVGFTCRHLHQRVDEHKRSTIGYHVKCWKQQNTLLRQVSCFEMSIKNFRKK